MRKIPENVMNQLNEAHFEKDKNCTNMTKIELGPETTSSSSVTMCVCNSTNCNLGPTQPNEDMIGAMMPTTESPNILQGMGYQDQANEV